MSTGLVPFDFEGHPVRAVTSDGGPWLIAADACGVLSIRDTSSALKMVDPEDVRRLRRSDTPQFFGGIAPQVQEITVVNESGLYALIFHSRKPEARRFKRWVTHEVLPTLRRTGHYEVAPVVQRSTELSRLELIEIAHTAELERLALAQENAELTEENAELRPKADAIDAMKGHQGCFYIAEVARIFEIRERKFFGLLYDEKILQKWNRQPYSKYLPWFRVTYDTIDLPGGGEKATCTTFVRPDGVWRLYHLLTRRGHRPTSPAGQVELVLSIPDDSRPSLSAIDRGNVTELPARRDDRPGGAA